MNTLQTMQPYPHDYTLEISRDQRLVGFQGDGSFGLESHVTEPCFNITKWREGQGSIGCGFSFSTATQAVRVAEFIAIEARSAGYEVKVTISPIAEEILIAEERHNEAERYGSIRETTIATIRRLRSSQEELRTIAHYLETDPGADLRDEHEDEMRALFKKHHQHVRNGRAGAVDEEIDRLNDRLVELNEEVVRLLDLAIRVRSKA